MPLDIEKYLRHFDGYDLPTDKKAEMIEALYSIAETFADLAFGLHPSQQFPDKK